MRTRRALFPSVSVDLMRWGVDTTRRHAAKPTLGVHWIDAASASAAVTFPDIERTTFEALFGRLSAFNRASRTAPAALRADTRLRRAFVAAAAITPCDRTQGFRRAELVRIAHGLCNSPWTGWFIAIQHVPAGNASTSPELVPVIPTHALVVLVAQMRAGRPSSFDEQWRGEFERLKREVAAQLAPAAALQHRFGHLLALFPEFPADPLDRNERLQWGIAAAAAVAPCSRRDGFRYDELMRIAHGWANSPAEVGDA